METELKKLMDYLPVLCRNYSSLELYQLGSILDYRDRIIYDYRIQCEQNNTDFHETTCVYYHEKDFLKKLMEHDELSYIIHHIREIIRGGYSLNKDLLQYIKNHKEQISAEDFEKVEKAIVCSLSEYYPHVKEEHLNQFYRLLKKTAEEENATLLDIEKIDYGGYAKIYHLKDKIIKVGCARACENIADNNRLLLPDFKGHIGPDYVEITDYIKRCESVTIEDIYEIYKDLREQGVVWLDPTERNIGILSEC